MFANDPQVKAYVNPIHQITGAQPRALADSVLAFAKNLNNLETLTPALELIAQKHVALNIHREHYPIVGRNLLAAMHGRGELMEGATSRRVCEASKLGL